MKKPTPQQVEEYARELGYIVDGKDWCDYWESIGWVRKKGCPMKDWKATFRNFTKRFPLQKIKKEERICCICGSKATRTIGYRDYCSSAACKKEGEGY